ncbi:MAG TPA: galactokinase [Acidobacteriota bacterium]
MEDLIAAVSTEFASIFPDAGKPKVALAPGRVNLIGEHTDYNEGYVLPAAIDRYVAAAFTPRKDGRVQAYSIDFQELQELEIAKLRAPGGSRWIDYIAGVAWALAESGSKVVGASMIVKGNVPVGAGLASSAAIEMSAARAFAALSGIDWDPPFMAGIGQKVENAYIGVDSGIMDQFVSAASKERCALLIDCRSLKAEAVPIPDSFSIVVMDTGARRTLAGSAYNERRASCRKAVEIIRRERPDISSLRDVDLSTLEHFQPSMDTTTFWRAKHVVQENFRPVDLTRALAVQDREAVGRLMSQSHASLKNLYEVSSRELDLMVALASRHPACIGARMTGAGFGGCAVALVDSDGISDFTQKVQEKYREQVDLPSVLFACKAAGGARIVT